MYYINVEFADSDSAPHPGPRGGNALRDFGFDESFVKEYLSVAETGEVPGRIVAVHRGRYAVVAASPEGDILEIEAVASGRLGHEALSAAELPAVGDWVSLRSADSAGTGPAVVSAVLPRRTVFARKAAGDVVGEAQVIAANVDTALILAAAGRDFNPRRIERYLTLAREAGVSPVIVVTKADLAEDPEALVERAAALSPGTPCFAICAPEGRGLDRLNEHLAPGKTVVLLGSSGAGKSTLLNAIAGRELARVGGVREDDERGRHTTTHRELYRLDTGALLIDSPGMRELQLWAGEEAVESAFAEIEALAETCRFRDCRHEGEPGCAVRAALESGELDPGRYASYKKLLREVSFLERKDDLGLQREETERWRTINKKMRNYSKERRAIEGRSY